MGWGLPFGGAAVAGDYCQRHLEAFELGGEPTFALIEGCCAAKMALVRTAYSTITILYTNCNCMNKASGTSISFLQKDALMV